MKIKFICLLPSIDLRWFLCELGLFRDTESNKKRIETNIATIFTYIRFPSLVCDYLHHVRINVLPVSILMYKFTLVLNNFLLQCHNCSWLMGWHV